MFLTGSAHAMACAAAEEPLTGGNSQTSTARAWEVPSTEHDEYRYEMHQRGDSYRSSWMDETQTD